MKHMKLSQNRFISRRRIKVYEFRNMFRHLLRKILVNHRWVELRKIIEREGYKSYLEVGLWKGENMRNILKIGGLDIVFAIDPYVKFLKNDVLSDGDYKDIRNECLKKIDDVRFSFIELSSVDASKHFDDGGLDIVFLDGAHDYTSIKKDIVAWLPKIRSGGTICGHDFNNRFHGVMDAVKESFDRDDIIIGLDDVWSVKVR